MECLRKLRFVVKRGKMADGQPYYTAYCNLPGFKGRTYVDRGVTDHMPSIYYQKPSAIKSAIAARCQKLGYTPEIVLYHNLKKV